MCVSCDSSDSVLELQVIAQADVTNAARVTFANSIIDDGDNRCESRASSGENRLIVKTAADRLNSEPIPFNPSSWCVSCRPLSAKPHPQSKPQPRLIEDNPRGSERTEGISRQCHRVMPGCKPLEFRTWWKWREESWKRSAWKNLLSKGAD